MLFWLFRTFYKVYLSVMQQIPPFTLGLAVALYKLSNKERDVILLRYFQSMSDQEIAELYHVSRSAIYRRRSNGLKKLKTVLKERN